MRIFDGQRRTLLFALALLALLAGNALAATVTDTVTKRLSVAGINEIELITSNGSIDVLSTAGWEVEVVATREAKSFTAWAARRVLNNTGIEIERDDAAAKLAVHVDFPHTWLFSTIAVPIQVRVPANWRGTLYAKTSNGRITTSGLGGNGTLRTSNGSIMVGGWQGSLTATTSNGKVLTTNTLLTGKSTFSTSNGSISAELSGVSGPVELRTSNGSVSLAMPQDTRANMEARTSNGSVDLRGISFTGDVETSRSHLTASLNGGGPEIYLRTSNGNIAVSGK